MNQVINKGKRKIKKVILQKVNGWKKPFEKVDIISTQDKSIQHAYFYNPQTTNATPLVVSLHSWAGNYEQIDNELSNKAVENGWNYIHPDFRGPNNNPDSVGSALSMSDINDAIKYCIDNGNVDINNIFIVGGSGGAYAGLCFYSNTLYPINSFIVWNPITDLVSWHNQSLNRSPKYSNNIIAATNSKDSLNIEEAKKRSPLYMKLPKINSEVHIFAGYKDGYEIDAENPVPITHSINYYNRLSKELGADELSMINQDTIIKLSTREVLPLNKKIDERNLIFEKGFEKVNLTIFDGGHIQLTNHTEKIIKNNLM